MNIEINGLSKTQMQIADFLWTCESNEEVQMLIDIYGHNAIIVRDMMIAAALDDIDDLSIAEEVINNIKGIV
jgi:predicted DNA-binding protein